MQPVINTYPFDMQVGHCVPDTCNEEQMLKIVYVFASKSGPFIYNATGPFNGLLDVYCPEQDASFGTAEIICTYVSRRNVNV